MNKATAAIGVLLAFVAGWIAVVILYKWIVLVILGALCIGFVWFKLHEAIEAWRMRDDD